MLSLRPTTARLAAKFRKPRAPIWDGLQREQIAPATMLEQAAAISLPDEYDRITGAIIGCDLAAWIDEAKGGPQLQPPTWRYNLGRTLVADGTIYYDRGYEVVKAGMARLLARGAPEHFAEAQLASLSLTETFFGHWLVDGSMLLLLAEQQGLVPLVPWTPGVEGWAHRPAYAAMLGIQAATPKLAWVDQLWSVDDRPRNAGRAARLHDIRARFRRHATGTSVGKRVFLTRGLGGVKRHLVNEEAIAELLATQYGFAVIDPLQMMPGDIVNALADAELIWGVEGSQTFHAIAAAADHACMFMIMPPDRFSVAPKWFADMAGMRFGFTVAARHGDGFVVPLDRVRAAMDLIERTLS